MSRAPLWRDPLFIAGAVPLALLILAALFAPYLTEFRPDELDIFAIEEPPSALHLLGTDEVGRDVWSRCFTGRGSRCWWGSRRWRCSWSSG